ncbi:MAG: hypothetical protein IJ056_04975 [Acidaminococcaceae bacterium]|nr:hypothetical protein [Acidaminococcaceae bacterium]MBQ9634684.1 hypothetical protein [Acidaminococcaceae bacterium]
MGLPDIDIIFKQKAVTAIKRSQRGVACVIVRDNTPGAAGYETYKFEKDIPANKYGADVLKALKRCFLVAVNKIIVLHIPEIVVEEVEGETVATGVDFSEALNLLNGLNYHYVCTTDPDGQQELANFVISKNRSSKGRKYVAVTYNAAVADSKYIVNVKNAWVHVNGDDANTDMEMYLPRLASILANLPMNRSCTYFELEDLEGIDMSFVDSEHSMDSWIDDGWLCLIKDDDEVMIGRGVNSLTTVTSTETEDMKKIIIVESMNLMEEDIYSTFKKEYVGRYKNSYDNQSLFISAVNTYFRELANEEILDPDYENEAMVNVEKQRNAWLGIGKTEAEEWKEDKVKRMTFRSNVFLAGDIKILDAIEDLHFEINME